MKTKNKTLVIGLSILMAVSLSVHAADMEFSGGVYAEITSTVEGSVWVYDATVAMFEPAHITEYFVATSGATVDIYGGQIDYMLMVTTDLNDYPEAEVTVYGTDFMVDGEPVEPGTTEVLLSYQTLSGVYASGTPFSFIVDCIIMGNSNFIFYQTVNLGWVVSQPDIEVSQTDVDFGQVDIGSTQDGVVTVYNLGDAPLTIQSLELTQSQQGQFGFTPLEMLPLTLDPNSGIDIDVQFSPVIEGPDTAVLSIGSNDPNDPAVDVVLTGEGMPVVLSPVEQIGDILAVFDAAVQTGTIEGIGNKKSAKNKLKTFGKMLTLADELIAAGYDEHALEILYVVEAKSDGQKRPKDFIQGDSVADLNLLINELIDTIQEE